MPRLVGVLLLVGGYAPFLQEAHRGSDVPPRKLKARPIGRRGDTNLITRGRAARVPFGFHDCSERPLRVAMRPYHHRSQGAGGEDEGRAATTLAQLDSPIQVARRAFEVVALVEDLAHTRVG